MPAVNLRKQPTERRWKRNKVVDKIKSDFIQIFIGILILHYYYVDPLDVDLLINEQAIYLTSRFTELKKIPT